MKMVGEVGPTSSSKWDCKGIWGSWCENGTMNEHGEVGQWKNARKWSQKLDNG
jgi:hypothetical protein